MKKIFAIAIIILQLPALVQAQQGKINITAQQDIIVTNMTGNLDFGNVIQNQGTVTIGQTDAKVVVLEVEGKENQQVRVTFTPPPSLQLDPSNTLLFTLGAAYNATGNNNAQNATPVTNPSATDAVFKLSKSQGSTKTGNAYVYIFGAVNVGLVQAGTYIGTINVTVQYY